MRVLPFLFRILSMFLYISVCKNYKGHKYYFEFSRYCEGVIPNFLTNERRKLLGSLKPQAIVISLIDAPVDNCWAAYSRRISLTNSITVFPVSFFISMKSFERLIAISCAIISAVKSVSPMCNSVIALAFWINIEFGVDSKGVSTFSSFMLTYFGFYFAKVRIFYKWLRMR